MRALLNGGARPKGPVLGGGPRKRKGLRTRLPYLALAIACGSATFFVIYLHSTNGAERQGDDQRQASTYGPEEDFILTAAHLFPEEANSLSTFCKAWRDTQSNRARDSFFWIRGLGVGEGLKPFSMAVPARTKGGAVGRALERQGTWAPDITDDLLDALDQAGEESLLIDVGAGLGWFSLASAAANHSVIAIETAPPRVAALRRSACANEDLQSRLALFAPPASSLISAGEMLLDSAPRMADIITKLKLRVGAVVVHQGTGGGEALEIMAAGASILWPDVTPLAVAMVLQGEGSDGTTNSSSERSREESELEELASIVLHKVRRKRVNIYIYIYIK